MCESDCRIWNDQIIKHAVNHFCLFHINKYIFFDYTPLEQKVIWKKTKPNLVSKKYFPLLSSFTTNFISQ